MKTLAVSLALVSSLALVGQAHSATVTEKDMVIGISEVYVPTGLSSQAEAYVIASGMFPNSCYKWLRADITHVGEFVHEISALATVTQGMCMMVIVPFQHDINLGHLPPGEHTLRFKNGDGTFFEKVLTIRQ